LNNDNYKFNINYNKLNELEKEQEKKEQDRIVLTYKLLKNLYLCLDIEKKHLIFKQLSEICLDSGEKMDEFFNDLFKYLNEKYEIKENSNNDSIISDGNSDLYNDDEDEDEDNFYEKKEKDKNEIMDENPKEKKEDNIMDNEIMKKYKYIELIKSICIRFIDEI